MPTPPPPLSSYISFLLLSLPNLLLLFFSPVGVKLPCRLQDEEVLEEAPEEEAEDATRGMTSTTSKEEVGSDDAGQSDGC